MDPLLSKALVVFVRESREHCVLLDKILLHEPLADERKELRRRVHMLKGGAGFFGLSELAAAASELEALIIGGADLAVGRARELSAEIARLVTEAARISDNSQI